MYLLGVVSSQEEGPFGPEVRVAIEWSTLQTHP